MQLGPVQNRLSPNPMGLSFSRIKGGERRERSPSPHYRIYRVGARRSPATLKQLGACPGDALFRRYDRYLIFSDNEAGQVGANSHWATVSRL